MPHLIHIPILYMLHILIHLILPHLIPIRLTAPLWSMSIPRQDSSGLCFQAASWPITQATPRPPLCLCQLASLQALTLPSTP